MPDVTADQVREDGAEKGELAGTVRRLSGVTVVRHDWFVPDLIASRQLRAPALI